MNRLIIIAGPTASGKSAAGIALAKDLSGSIISADSMQVYRHMDIGTAKLSFEEMQGIPHYLIDLVEPDGEWNVVRFQEEAKKAVREIEKAGRLPIVVGGTGFYIQALLYDIDFTSTEEDLEFREEMETLAGKEGPEAVHALLEKADPAAAQAIHPNNVRRVIRALEYARQTGEKISDHNKREREREPAFDAVCFCLTMNRDRLYQRIDRRVDEMMEKGLADEVKALRDSGYRSSLVSMQGLGYRQLIRFYDGLCTEEEAVEDIKRQTRHFAKRQLTWFRREKNVIWIDADRYATAEEMTGEMEAIVREHWPDMA